MRRIRRLDVDAPRGPGLHRSARFQSGGMGNSRPGGAPPTSSGSVARGNTEAVSEAPRLRPHGAPAASGSGSPGRSTPLPGDRERGSTGGNVMTPSYDRQQNRAAEEARLGASSLVKKTSVPNSLSRGSEGISGSRMGAEEQVMGEHASNGDAGSSSKKRPRRMDARSYIKRFKTGVRVGAPDVVVAYPDRMGKENTSSGHVTDSNTAILCEGGTLIEKSKGHSSHAACKVSKSPISGLHETSDTRVDQCSTPLSEVQPHKPTDVQNVAAESSLPAKDRDPHTGPARQNILPSFQSVPISTIHHEEIKSTLGDAEPISVQKENSAPGHLQVARSDGTDGNPNICVACGLGSPGTFRSCDGKGCKSRYHMSCLDQYLSLGNWFCTSCTKKRLQFGLHHIVDGIESVWDVKEAEGMQTSKQYFVKYKNLAHVHNRWVPEGIISVMPGGPDLLSLFNKRNHTEKTIRKEWTKPHRLLSKRLLVPPRLAEDFFRSDDFFCSSGVSYCTLEWLVKWRGLGYDHATWELETLSCLCTPEADKLKENYENRREDAKQSSIPPKTKIKQSSFQKLESLPDGCHPDFDNDHLYSINHVREYWHKSRGAVLVDDKEYVIKTVLFTMSVLPDVSQPFLILTTPDSLSLWEVQFNKLAPFVNVVVYDGGKDELKLIRDLEFYESGSRSMLQVLLSHPDAILEDIEPIAHIGWEAVIVDYYQKSALQYLEQLKQFPTDFRMLLVSSPVKDNLAEYVKLLAFLNSVEQENENYVDTAETLKMLEGTFKSHIAYERQSDSSKILEYWVPAYVSQLQLQMYCSILLSSSSVLQSQMTSDKALYDIIISLSKCCDDPYPVDEFLRNPPVNNHDHTDPIVTRVQACGKLLLLQKMLEAIRNKRLRVIILFQPGVAGDILEAVVRHNFGPESYERVEFRGSLSKKAVALNKFNDKTKGRFVFLIEASACLPSIELSSVDAVIIYNSDWNPLNDQKAIQRIKIESQFRYPSIFRLYTPFTMEEKCLVLAKQGMLIDTKDIIHSISHSLISWGASCLFTRLDELKHGNCASKSSERVNFMDKVISEFLTKLATNVVGSTEVNCTFISEANMSGKFYSRNITLVGEKEEMRALDGDPSKFWLNLLDGKSPSWSYISEPPQSSHEILQNMEEPAKVPAEDANESRRKRRKVGKITGPSKRTRTPKYLHVQLKKELSKLIKALQLPDDVRAMVEQLFEYFLKNHLVATEPVGMLHAFIIALCLRAASVLKYKINCGESIALAGKSLNCECNEELAEFIYKGLRFPEEKNPNREIETRINSQPVSVVDTQISCEETSTNLRNNHMLQNEEMDHGNLTSGGPQEASSGAERMISEEQEPVQETHTECHLSNDELPTKIVEKRTELVDNDDGPQEASSGAERMISEGQEPVQETHTECHLSNDELPTKIVEKRTELVDNDDGNFANGALQEVSSNAEHMISEVQEPVQESHGECHLSNDEPPNMIVEESKELVDNNHINFTNGAPQVVSSGAEHMILEEQEPIQDLSNDDLSNMITEKRMKLIDNVFSLRENNILCKQQLEISGLDTYTQNEVMRLKEVCKLILEHIRRSHIDEMTRSDIIFWFTMLMYAFLEHMRLQHNKLNTLQSRTWSVERHMKENLHQVAKSDQLDLDFGRHIALPDSNFVMEEFIHFKEQNKGAISTQVMENEPVATSVDSGEGPASEAVDLPENSIRCSSDDMGVQRAGCSSSTIPANDDLIGQESSTGECRNTEHAEADNIANPSMLLEGSDSLVRGLNANNDDTVDTDQVHLESPSLASSQILRNPDDRSQTGCQPDRATDLSQGGTATSCHSGEVRMQTNAKNDGNVAGDPMLSESPTYTAHSPATLPVSAELGTQICQSSMHVEQSPEVQQSTSMQDQPAEERACILGATAAQASQPEVQPSISAAQDQPAEAERAGTLGAISTQVLQPEMQSSTSMQGVQFVSGMPVLQNPSIHQSAGVELSGMATPHATQPPASMPAEQSMRLPAQQSLVTLRHPSAEAEPAGILATEAACDLQPEVRLSTSMQDQPAEGACMLDTTAARGSQPEVQPSTPMQDQPAETERAGTLGAISAQVLQPEMQSSTSTQGVPFVSGMPVLQSPSVHQSAEVELSGMVTPHAIQPPASMPAEQITCLPAQQSLVTLLHPPAEAEAEPAGILATEAACNLQSEVRLSTSMQDQPAEGACMLDTTAARGSQPEVQPPTSTQCHPSERTHVSGMPVLQSHTVHQCIEPSLDSHAGAESTDMLGAVTAPDLQLEIQPSASIHDRPAGAEGAGTLGSTAAQDLQPERQLSTTVQHIPLEIGHEQPTQLPPIPALVFHNPILSDEPLKNELEKIIHWTTLLDKGHEDKRSQLQTERNQEIEKINRKYDSLLQNEDSAHRQKRIQLDVIYQKVYVSKSLAENFRRQFTPSVASPGRSTGHIMDQLPESSSASQGPASLPVIPSPTVRAQVHNSAGPYVRPSPVASRPVQSQSTMPGNLSGAAPSPFVPVPLLHASNGPGGSQSRAIQPQPVPPSILVRTMAPAILMPGPQGSHGRPAGAVQLRAASPHLQHRMRPPHGIIHMDYQQQQQLPVIPGVPARGQFVPVSTESLRPAFTQPGAAVLASMTTPAGPAHQPTLPSASGSGPATPAYIVPPGWHPEAVWTPNPVLTLAQLQQQASYLNRAMGGSGTSAGPAAPGGQQHAGGAHIPAVLNLPGLEALPPPSNNPYMPARFGLEPGSGGGGNAAGTEVVCLSDDEA
ncbi:uncharacterized protein LOC123406185 isoform X2 [Hordeum vulgare subsp. vulgare]|uniref:uncharacterized protein LOC123406185 isoform X2 n=1 Tax=Hordeum vulgare subsp. vulgare TaxID=112509 RepID=UPI001D1A47DA|nr:uncharacterized protein LOC123406185 isoform X2 [Hordeum vulgare subsp. vulgare]